MNEPTPVLAALAPIPRPDASASTSAQKALAEVREHPIVDAGTASNMGLLLRAIKTRWTEIDEARKKLKAPVDAAAAAIQEFFREPLTTLATAEREAKAAIGTWEESERRRVAEEQRRADEQARREREAAEQRAREIQLKAEEEQRRLTAEAESAAAAGNQVEAERLLATAVSVGEKAESKAAAQVEKAATTVAPVITGGGSAKGVGTRENWKFRIVDAAAIPREYLVPDESAIGQVVKALKGNTKIPGITVYREDIVSARRA